MNEPIYMNILMVKIDAFFWKSILYVFNVIILY